MGIEADQADDTVGPVLVGLTGGIGAGKSTVAGLLAQRGAVVVDADAVAREVTEPGAPAYDDVVARFGPQVVGSDGRVDRGVLADLVFANPVALADLNAIVHPHTEEAIRRRVEPLLAEGRTVVVEVPLLVEAGWTADVVVVVDCDEDVAVARAAAARGVSEAEVRRRVRAQVGREERRRAADHVVDNGGSRAELEVAVGRLWTDLANP